jgi:hypothetical protein
MEPIEQKSEEYFTRLDQLKYLSAYSERELLLLNGYIKDLGTAADIHYKNLS